MRHSKKLDLKMQFVAKYKQIQQVGMQVIYVIMYYAGHLHHSHHLVVTDQAL